MSNNGAWGFVGSFIRAFLKSAGKQQSKSASQQPTLKPTQKTQSRQQASRANSAQGQSGAEPSPGQTGDDATRDLERAELLRLKPSYSPAPDGNPDPGEIVWTWVPYAEDDGRGKDRPVLIIARINEHATAGCYLSTKQHRDFVSVGTGAWDSQGRESFLAPDRVLRVTDRGMRREGHVLPRDRFVEAAAAVVRMHGIRP